MADNKKRHVVSYEKMALNPALAAAFAEKYPRGFNDYLTDLVKINVKTDDLEDVERWLEGEEDAENEAVAGGSADASDSAGETLPDDNIAQYAGGSDDE